MADRAAQITPVDVGQDSGALAAGNKPRVLFIAPQPFLSNRGSPFRVRTTVNALVAAGMEVDLLVLPYGEDVEIPGVNIIRTRKIWGVDHVPIGPSWIKFAYGLLQLVTAYKWSGRYRYVSFHGIEEAALSAGLLGRLRGVPYVVDMHSLMREQLSERPIMGSALFLRAFDFLERRCLQGAAGAITVCDELTDRAKRLGKNDSRHSELPAVTVTDIALPNIGSVDREDVARLRREFEIGSQPTIVYTGNLKNYQGIGLLLSAFALLCSLPFFPGALLLMVGGGPEESEEKRYYQSMAARLGLQRNIRWAGLRPPDEMPAFYALADVLVSPRTTGCNTPLKIYSYLASGRPVVATNISSHTQVIDERCAFICEPTEESMAEALRQALDSSEAGEVRRKQKVERGLELIDSTLSERQFRQNVRWLYDHARPSPMLAANSGTAAQNSAAAEARAEDDKPAVANIGTFPA